MTLWGATLGDVGLQVVDDTVREKVYLKLVHPASIRDVTLDPFGNVKGYLLEELREHPAKPGTTVTYSRAGEPGRGRRDLSDVSERHAVRVE